MSSNSIWKAANDQDLIRRVQAMAQKEAEAQDALGQTIFGRQLIAGSTNVAPLMWPVAVDTEDEYETALNSGRGAPGYDQDIITDGMLTAAIVAGWPPDSVFTPIPPVVVVPVTP